MDSGSQSLKALVGRLQQRLAQPLPPGPGASEAGTTAARPGADAA
jgi:hypothetical protein